MEMAAEQKKRETSFSVERLYQKRQGLNDINIERVKESYPLEARTIA